MMSVKTPETTMPRIQPIDVDPVATPPFEAMIKLVEQPAMIKSLTNYGLQADDDDQPRVQIKVIIEAVFGHDPKSPQSYRALPITKEAGDALIRESARIHDGKNTTTLKVRRSFPTARYSFQAYGEAIDIEGEVVGTPSIRVVAEEVLMTWTIKGSIGKTTFNKLWPLTNSPVVLLTVDEYQVGLFDSYVNEFD